MPEADERCRWPHFGSRCIADLVGLRGGLSRPAWMLACSGSSHLSASLSAGVTTSVVIDARLPLAPIAPRISRVVQMGTRARPQLAMLVRGSTEVMCRQCQQGVGRAGHSGRWQTAGSQGAPAVEYSTMLAAEQQTHWRLDRETQIETRTCDARRKMVSEETRVSSRSVYATVQCVDF